MILLSIWSTRSNLDRTTPYVKLGTASAGDGQSDSRDDICCMLVLTEHCSGASALSAMQVAS